MRTRWTLSGSSWCGLLLAASMVAGFATGAQARTAEVKGDHGAMLKIYEAAAGSTGILSAKRDWSRTALGMIERTDQKARRLIEEAQFFRAAVNEELNPNRTVIHLFGAGRKIGDIDVWAGAAANCLAVIEPGKRRQFITLQLAHDFEPRQIHFAAPERSRVETRTTSAGGEPVIEVAITRRGQKPVVKQLPPAKQVAPYGRAIDALKIKGATLVSD